MNKYQLQLIEFLTKDLQQLETEFSIHSAILKINNNNYKELIDFKNLAPTPVKRFQ